MNNKNLGITIDTLLIVAVLLILSGWLFLRGIELGRFFASVF